MAYKSCSILASFFILGMLLSSFALARRNIPTDSKNVDKKQPESFLEHDRGFLVPGLGRFVFPRLGDHFNPFTYNPVTGTSGGGNGVALPGSGSTGSTGSIGGGSYVPGGDDTFIPNPGVEVPSGGSVPALPHP